MYVSDYNTLFFHHHPQCTDDVIKVHAITGESTGDFSVDFSGDCIRCSHLRFHYMSSSLTAPQMFCRTRLLEVFRLLVLGDAVLISCRVSSQHTQHSFCILLQVSHNNKLSTSVDACSALFFGWFFLDIIIRSCELLSPYQYLLASSISLACVRGCDEHHERQLFFVRFCSCGSLMVCNLFFYTHFRLAEMSDRDIFNELLIFRHLMACQEFGLLKRSLEIGLSLAAAQLVIVSVEASEYGVPHSGEYGVLGPCLLFHPLQPGHLS